MNNQNPAHPETPIKELLKSIQEKLQAKIPEKIASTALSQNVLHIRFTHPQTRETDVEPLPFKTPAFLFRDEQTGEITAIEVLDIESLLAELKIKTRKAPPNTPPPYTQTNHPQ